MVPQSSPASSSPSASARSIRCFARPMVAAALVRAGEGQGRVSSERAGCFGLEGVRPVAALALSGSPRRLESLAAPVVFTSSKHAAVAGSEVLSASKSSWRMP